MSLLLDARRKLQQAQSAQQGGHASPAAESSQETGATAPQADQQARDTGHNLFAAKFPFPIVGHTLPNRNLLYALGGTILLLTGGMAYLWYVNSASNTTPLHPISAPPAPPPHPQPLASTATQNAPIAETGQPSSASGTGKIPLAAAIPAESAPAPQPHNRTPISPNSTIRIEPQKTELVDPLLRDAYLAYHNGKSDEARQLYLAMFKKDAHNPDVLLGLAVISQERGETQMAAQYFGRVLALDPRNAAANAGMSALSTDEDYSESRLKILLREQGNSAVLHFALGNLYAGQSRWGEAQQAYFNAYTLEPGNAEYVFNLAVSLDHLGQNKLAAQHYQRAMQLDPSHSAGFDHAQISQRAQELAR